MGLVFVSVSLTTNLETTREAESERRLFVTPIVFQFGYSLAMSAIALAPWPNIQSFGALTLVAGVAATVQCIGLLRNMFVRHRVNERVATVYWLYNGVLPLLAALTLATSGAVMVATDALRLELVVGSTLALDLLGVSNAWRLTVWIISHTKR